jgi:hypothetical protein
MKPYIVLAVAALVTVSVPAASGTTLAQAPTPTITGPTSPTNQTSATFTFSDDDPLATFECRLDGVDPFEACLNGAEYTVGEGDHVLEVRAVDPLIGDPSEPAAYPWTVDTTPPPPPQLTAQPDPVGNNSNPHFAFTDTDTAVTFKCRLDPLELDFTDCPDGTKDYPGLADGSYTFEVKAVDPAQNASNPSTYGFTVDTTNPVVTITGAPPHLTNQTHASFQFHSSETNSTFTCQLDAKAPTSCDPLSPQPYLGLTDGAHTFMVEARTPAGNTGQASYTWTIDTVPPETTIASGPPASSNSASAAFTFTSGESGSTFFCSLNSSGFAPCTSPRAYSGLGDGTYTFHVQAVDAAGNVDPSAATYTWTISGVGPPIADLRPPANVSRLRRSVGYGRLQLRWLKPRDADFDHVGVYVSTSPKTPPRKLLYTGKAQTYTDRHFKNGQYYRYLVVSYDHAKNASGGKPALVRPSALLVAPRPGSAVRKAPTFRWAGVRGAAFYNIQLWKNGEKILSRWPGKARQVLSRGWRYRGRRYSLSHGVYVWYVWPGFGPRTQARYGQLLGYASFRVR